MILREWMERINEPLECLDHCQSVEQSVTRKLGVREGDKLGLQGELSACRNANQVPIEIMHG
jgi:hypothetical protein